MHLLKKTLENICNQKVVGNPRFRWFNENTACLEYIDFKIGVDLFIGKDNIAIDIVLRKGVERELITKIYPQLARRNKWRLATINKNLAVDYLPTLINTEYARLLSIFYNRYEEYINPDRLLYYVDNQKKLIGSSPIKMFFWDGVPNFGDQVGPWIASCLSKRPVLNVRGLNKSTNAIFGVGSIIQMINKNHQHCNIWGSGLIDDKNINAVMRRLKSANVKKISGVRGKLTEKYLKSYDFDVAPVYGDPALIFSNLYEPNKIQLKSKKVIVPHYVHYELFKSLNLEGYHIVNVGDGVTNVIDQISNADLVISTSLHGLILAQSYGVPWAHLHLIDAKSLVGDDFKFHDYFTTLDDTKVTQVKVSLSDLNQKQLDIVSKQVSLPNYSDCYNSQAIMDAFFEYLN